MSNKRRLVDYDEDPEDSDFDIRDSAPARKKVKKTVSGVKSRPKVQKSRGRYKGSGQFLDVGGLMHPMSGTCVTPSKQDV